MTLAARTFCARKFTFLDICLPDLCFLDLFIPGRLLLNIFLSGQSLTQTFNSPTIHSHLWKKYIAGLPEALRWTGLPTWKGLPSITPSITATPEPGILKHFAIDKKTGHYPICHLLLWNKWLCSLISYML